MLDMFSKIILTNSILLCIIKVASLRQATNSLKNLQKLSWTLYRPFKIQKAVLPREF